ncbi:hypothetical protein Avbf_09899 [Armadillidium vulgare]|nr:hypothetical protein Avbf_09899 [Armadillidium vulgare]
MQFFYFKQSLAVKPSKFLRESRLDFKFLKLPLCDLRNYYKSNVNDFSTSQHGKGYLLMFIFGFCNI